MLVTVSKLDIEAWANPDRTSLDLWLALVVGNPSGPVDLDDAPLVTAVMETDEVEKATLCKGSCGSWSWTWIEFKRNKRKSWVVRGTPAVVFGDAA